MLSYQHAYHVGSAADVHKHLHLALLLARLTQKPRPLTYMETHAGRGLYDLASVEARKTAEADAGITAMLGEGRMPTGPYRHVLEAVRARHGATAYPGSPLIAAEMLRPGDRLHLMELHPREHAALAAALTAPNIHIHKRDGYDGVLALSPPTPRRGMVLVDPSYEVKSEYGQAADFVVRLLARWPQAVVMLWYPILPAGLHEDLRARLEAARLPGMITHEVDMPPHWEKGMRGSGVVIANPPYGMADIVSGLAWPFMASRLLGGSGA
jgi:23S rRNA (adenine2030-N6)-methyltransferase